MGLLAWLLMPRVSCSVTAAIQLLANPRNPCRTKQHVEPETMAGHAQFFQRRARAGEIAARHQCDESLDTTGFERDTIFPFDVPP